MSDQLPDIYGDMQRRQKEMEESSLQMNQMIREDAARKEEQFGVHRLNDRLAALTQLLTQAARASDAATTENLKLQTKFGTLNARLFLLTWVILGFTAVGALSAVIQAYYARVSYNLSLQQSHLQSSQVPPKTK